MILVTAQDAGAQKAERSGKEVVESLCSACHATGVRGAPRIAGSAGRTRLLALSGDPARVDEVRAALSAVALDRQSSLPVRVLSQGQRRRVALGPARVTTLALAP